MILTRPLRKPFWIINSFFKKHRLIILGASIIAVIFLLASKNIISLLPQAKKEIRIGIVGQYNLSTLPPSIGQTISQGLIKLNLAGEIEPGLAKSWQILEDETLYRLYLNPNVFWSDDTVIENKDIKLNISNVKISYPEPGIIDFKLKESFSPFLTTLSRPILKDNQVTASQYLIKKTKYQGPYLKSLSLVGKKENLTYRFYPSHEAAWLGFKLGEVDKLDNLITNPLSENWKTKVNLEESVNYQQYLAILFNLEHPQLTVKSLRQALAYAIKDKSNSSSTRAFGPISPLSWAYNSNLKPYDYSQNQAKELFEKATEEASISAKFELNLATSQTFLPLAESIAKSWQDTLDIKVNVKIISSIEPDFETLLVAQEIPLDPDQHALWHSTQTTNISKFSDLKVDKLLEDGRKTSDLKKRKEIYLDFQKFLVEDSPAIFLQYPTTYTISRK